MGKHMVAVQWKGTAAVLAMALLLGACTSSVQQAPDEAGASASRGNVTVVRSGAAQRAQEVSSSEDSVKALAPLVDGGRIQDAAESGGWEGQEEIPETQLQWDLSMLPYRAMLPANEQRIYDLVYAKIVELTPRFVMPYEVTSDRINDIVHAVYYDNPELFWIDSVIGYGYTPDNRVTDIKISFNGLEQNFAQEKKRFEAAADRIISQAGKLSTDVEKERFVHDAIVKESEYRLGAPLNQSAYSVLVGKSSVCAGYARAFQYIMMKLGIPCYYCVGYADEDHAWNIVKLDGEYYNVDLSWDDPVGNKYGEVCYEYFNLTDEKLAYDHERRDLSVNLPACTGTKYSYNRAFSPDIPVRQGGAPQDYRELGFRREDAVQTLDEYFTRSEQAVVENGRGTYDVSFLLKNEALQKQIYAAIANRGWFDAFVIPAAQTLRLERYSAEISVTSEELAEGYMLLTQTVTLQ